jgi:hypothetical protein
LLLNHQIQGLALALTYREEAFPQQDPSLVALAARLISRAGQGEDISTEVNRLLEEHDFLNEWIAQVDEDPEGRPPHLQPDVVRSYKPIVAAGVVTAKKFVCPLAHGFTWYRRSLADEIPLCPFDNSVLVSA